MDLLKGNLDPTGIPSSSSSSTVNDNDNLPDIPIEHLEYSYVEKCSNRTELENILLVLKSGKHGKFEMLEKTVEDRMLTLMTPYDRNKWIAMNRDPTWNEKQQASKEVFDWLNKMSTVMHNNNTPEEDNNANSTNEYTKNKSTAHHLPPVRGSQPNSSVVPLSVGSSSASITPSSSSSSSSRLQLTNDTAPNTSGSNIGTSSGPKRDSKAEPFDQYYKRWENYDVEGELSKAEQQIGQGTSSSSSSSVPTPVTNSKPLPTVVKNTPTPSSSSPSSTPTATGPFATSKVISSHNQNISLPVDLSTMTTSDRLFSAKREKEKGNDYFRAEEYENAIKSYTRALLYDASPANATILYANRAQAHLKIKEWEHAENDCNSSLEADGKNFKAYLRRSAARTNRGKYYEAIVDAKQVIRIAESMDSSTNNSTDASTNPTHIITQAQKLIEEAQTKAKTAGIDYTLPSTANGSTEGISSNISSTNTTTGSKGPRRVVIEEDDDDEEEEDDKQTKAVPVSSQNKPTVTKPLIQPIEEVVSVPAPATASTTSTRRRVMIVEEDEDEEEEIKEKSKESSNSSSSSPPLPTATTSAIVPPTKPTVVPSVPTNTKTTSSTELADKAKEEGNQLFQQGKYMEAITAYNSSLSFVPHIPAVISNRAAARLKLQQWSSAIIDCTSALDICGLTKEIIQNTANNVIHHQSSSSGTSTNHPDYSSVIPSSLVSTAVKALFRRAQAFKEQGSSQPERLQDAIRDMASALYFEPHNNKIQMELRELRAQSKATTNSSSSTSVPVTSPPLSVKLESPVKKITEVTPNSVSSLSSPSTTTPPPSTNGSGGTPMNKQVPQPTKISEEFTPTTPTITKAVTASVTPSSSSSSPAVRTPTASSSSTASGTDSASVIRRGTPGSGTKKIPSCPRTSFDLESGVTSLRKDPLGMYQFCSQLTGSQLIALFKTPADADMLKTMLHGLRMAFSPLPGGTSTSTSTTVINSSPPVVTMDTKVAEWIITFLQGLTKSIGFTTLVDMMIEGERENMETLVRLAQSLSQTTGGGSGTTKNSSSSSTTELVEIGNEIIKVIHHRKDRIEMEVIHNYDG